MAVAVAASLPFVYVDKLYFALGSTSFWVVVTVGAQQAIHCWPSSAKPRKTEWQVGMAHFLRCYNPVLVYVYEGTYNAASHSLPHWIANCHTCVTALRQPGHNSASLQQRCLPRLHKYLGLKRSQ